MHDSEVELTSALKSRLPKAVMATYHGREFPAPLFDLATTPAGNIYSTAEDQAKLLSFLLANGKGPKGQLLKPETLESICTIQFKKEGDKSGFGLGFLVSQFEGHRTVGHGGAVYGYATEFAFLPEAKLGIFISASRDVANGLTRHLGEVALRSFLAVKNGKPLPVLNHTEPLTDDTIKAIVGVYRNAGKRVEITASEGKAYIFPPREGTRFEIRRFGKELVVDDPLLFGPPIKLDGDTLTWKNNAYKREAAAEEKPIPAHWEGLVGEYGPEHNHLTILEKDGTLCALIEWAFLYPMREVSENVFKFPDFGLYHGHEVKFIRDKSGRATAVEAANYRFDRIPLPKHGETFKIAPVRPVEELRKIALAAEPPVEKNSLLRKPDLVDLTKLDPSIKLDIRYASNNNFLGTPFYTSSKALMQRPAAEALVRVNKKLEKLGYGLLIHDAYRPWYVTKMFHDATPPRHHGFVADPTKGSRHNRGCAVDLTLYDRETGTPVEMVSGYDEFSDRSYPDYLGGTTKQRKHREILRSAMESEGYTVFPAEWWHFDYRDWREYPILNVRFEDLK
jgi:serine beta-lactamase-like protein LACTB